MTALLTPDRRDAIVDSVTESMREPIKQAVKEAIHEAETESTGGPGKRGMAGSVRLFGLGVAIGYALRSRASTGGIEPLEETKSQLAEAVQEGEDELSGAEGFEEVDITEEEPESEADTDGGRNFLSRILLMLGIAVLGYALKSRSDLVEEVADDAADQIDETVERTSEEAGGVTDEIPETSTDGLGTDEQTDDIGIAEESDEDDEPV